MTVIKPITYDKAGKLRAPDALEVFHAGRSGRDLEFDGPGGRARHTFDRGMFHVATLTGRGPDATSAKKAAKAALARFFDEAEFHHGFTKISITKNPRLFGDRYEVIYQVLYAVEGSSIDAVVDQIIRNDGNAKPRSSTPPPYTPPAPGKWTYADLMTEFDRAGLLKK